MSTSLLWTACRVNCSGSLHLGKIGPTGFNRWFERHLFDHWSTMAVGTSWRYNQGPLKLIIRTSSTLECRLLECKIKYMQQR